MTDRATRSAAAAQPESINGCSRPRTRRRQPKQTSNVVPAACLSCHSCLMRKRIDGQKSPSATRITANKHPPPAAVAPCAIPGLSRPISVIGWRTTETPHNTQRRRAGRAVKGNSRHRRQLLSSCGVPTLSRASRWKVCGINDRKSRGWNKQEHSQKASSVASAASSGSLGRFLY